MIEKVYLQRKERERLDGENQTLADECQRRGIPVEFFQEKQILRQRLPLRPEWLVAGDIPVVQSALKQLGAVVPVPLDYPPSLQGFLRRKIWESQLGEVRNAVYEAADVTPFFVKPKGKLKRFEGRVVHTWNDLSDTYMISRYCEVYCAEPVRWFSEYRAFVLNGEILGIRWYGGDTKYQVDQNVVTEAVRTLEAAREGHAAYALDFGVMWSGETALVEMNDAFSLGAYGLEPALYTDLILARWNELMSTINPD